jgi:pimeloyl-ACP methyl ester carboxylesterase
MPESADESYQPTQKFFESQRLKISYWDWGNEDAPPLVLVHGGRDHSRQWDKVARVFRDRFHVVAMDMRGHGDSDWAVGSQYGLPDMALDVVRMIETVGAPATVICHSYGAQATTVAAAAYPEVFARLVAIEGVASGVIRRLEMNPEWIREWGDKAREAERPRMRVYKTVEEAAERMLEQNAGLPRDLLHTIASYATKPVDGGFVWKFDGWVLNRTSMEVRRDELPRFWAAVKCPTLLVSGGVSHLRIEPGNPVLNIFPNARLALIEGAAHWVHHDKLDEFVEKVSAFLDAVPLKQ